MSRYTVLSNLLGGEMLSSFFESAVYFFMQEIWKKVPIEPFSEHYEVSNLGRVRSTDRVILCKNGVARNIAGKSIRPFIVGKGYEAVELCSGTVSRYVKVHRLVALAFIANENPLLFTQVNHIDENKRNNRADNLEWCSASYNVNYGTANERRANSLGKPFVSRNENDEVVAKYQKLSEVKEDGFCPSRVQSALHGMEAWKRVHDSNPEHRYKGRTWWYV